jgi:hypothetical protein
MENEKSMFGGSNNIKLLLEKNQIWETYHDKVSIDDAIASYVKAMKERRDDVLNKAKEFINENQEYIAGIDPIPMPDGEMPKAEHVVVIKGARGEYEAVTKSNVEIIIEKYRHVLTPEHIKDLRESVNDTNAEQMGIMEEAVASFNPRLIVMEQVMAIMFEMLALISFAKDYLK